MAQKSDVWNHFIQIRNDEGKVREAKCKYCNVVFAHLRPPALTKHLRKTHPARTLATQGEEIGTSRFDADASGAQTLEIAAKARCDLFDCVCCWRRACSPRIPRVAPGREYVCLPAGADDGPEWSLLVGFLSDAPDAPVQYSESVLGLHRFRVARSGRILGRSGKDLRFVHRAQIKGRCIPTANAALTPDGRSLCLFSEYVDLSIHQLQATPVAQLLQLTGNPSNMPPLQLLTGGNMLTASALPRLPLEPAMLCRPVSAAGRLWAPSVCPERLDSCSLAMHRLDEVAGRWEQVGITLQLPHRSEIPSRWGGDHFQGYAVLHGDTILISLRPSYGLFVTFDCNDGTWNEVIAKNRSNVYVPILGRGIHIKEEEVNDHGAVYFLRDSTIYAYKLLYDEGKLRLEPPTRIDSICPFGREGYGFLTHLGGRLMCSVWIRISPGIFCNLDGCSDPHVLITTFRLRSMKAAIKGIDVLHSTFRRLDVPTGIERNYQFCFLQEYEDQKPSVPLRRMPDDPVSSHVIKSSKMLDCCRSFLSERILRCYEFVDTAAKINKELYIMCRAGSQAIVYVAKIEKGGLKCHDNLLPQRFSLTTSDRSPPWHLVFSSCRSNIYAVSNAQDSIQTYSVMEEPTQVVLATNPSYHPFSMVLQVGDMIIAIRDSLHVYWYNQSKWVRYRRHTNRSLDLHNKGNLFTCRRRDGPLLLNGGKANLCGYAVLDDHSFVVTDADTMSFLHFDLWSENWSVLNRMVRWDLLNGRSVFVDGFIYTCTEGGLLAYELVQRGDDKVLQEPIFLQFSWRKPWCPERMCLDCADKDNIPDAIIFCVVQGEYCYPGPRSHDVHITTVQVKTRRTPRGNRRPERLDHVDIGTCYVEHDMALVHTESCFAVET